VWLQRSADRELDGDGFVCSLGGPAPVPRFELPEQPEALGMPAQEHIGLEDKEGFLPTADMTGEEDEPGGSVWVDRGFWTRRWRRISY